jgi:monoamine oxidase
MFEPGGNFLKLCEVENGAQQDAIAGGSAQLTEALYKDITKRGVTTLLSEPVTEVEQNASNVVVHTKKNSYIAHACIIAMSPMISSRIKYSPPLPTSRDSLTQRMPLGSVIKVVVIYKEAWWRNRGYTGQIVSDEGPVCATFDHSDPEHNFFALIGFIAGKHAIEWRDKGKEARKKAVTEEFKKLFECEEATNPLEYHDKDWNEDEWSRGCYFGLCSPGVLSFHGPAIRQPCGRIFWAGTETATHWSGYMDGAIQSGKRVASEVLRLLQ